MSQRFTSLYVLVILSVLCALPFFLGTQPLELNDSTGVLNTGDGDPIKQAALLAMYALAAVLMFRPSRGPLFLGLPLLVLFVWCCASVLWSVNPEGSVRRLVALSGTVMIGVCAGIRLDLESMMRVIMRTTVIVLLASLVVAAVLPLAGFDAEGRLRGVFAHKNLLSTFAVMGLLTIFFRAIDPGPGRWSITALGSLSVLCIVCLLISQSAGPFPALLFTVVVLALAYAALSGSAAWLPIAIAILVVAAGATVTIEGLSLFGRGDDFSGRLPVWQFAISMVDHEPWAGYGYGVFWLGMDAPAAPFWKATFNFVPHAHNGYIELALDAGLLGLGLYLCAMVCFFVRTWRLARADFQRNRALWALAVVTFLSIINLGEAKAWVGNDLQTLLFIYFVVRINIEYRRYTMLKHSAPGAIPARSFDTAAGANPA